MKWSRIQILCWLATLVSPGTCITLLGVLQSYPELSTLYSYVSGNGSTNGTGLLGDANNFTFLAPSNTAIKNLLASNPNALTQDLVDATLQYSLLNGGYPSLSFTNTSQFVASNLNNASYANVTGGQRVELVLGPSGEPQILSGNKSISTSPGTELVCTGGFVHIIDEVLTVPLTTVLEITAAGLEYFTSILNIGDYLNTANAGYVNGILEVPDVTYFIPNSASALANATNIIKVNGSSDDLQALFEYHIVPDFVGYSSLLTNGTSLKTAQGDNITITMQDGDMFVNSAKVITKDWIVANGVIHVIDNLLNRFDKSLPPPPTATSSSTSAASTPTTTSTPAPSPTTNAIDTSTAPPSSSKSGGLSTGAQVGIGVGVSIFGLALIAAIGFFLFRSRKQKHGGGMWDNGSMSGGTPEMGKYYVKRGTIQRQEDLGLGLQSSGMHRDEIGTAHGGEDMNAGGPDIPPRSPSRALRGGGDNYF